MSLPHQGGFVAPNLPLERVAEFAEAYAKTIDVPAIKIPKPYVLAPVGLIGAGKSTIVVSLAKKLNLVRICTDDIRRLLKESGFSYAHTLEIATVTHRLFGTQGYGIALDANAGSVAWVKLTRQLFKEIGAPVVWIHINTPESVILERLENYKPSWLFTDGEHAVKEYFRNKEHNKDMLKENFPFLYTFDTSRDDVARQIDDAAALIQAAVDGGTVPEWK
ncbi:MAG: AAA family ATPase [Patescibacteria group bacterium]